LPIADYTSPSDGDIISYDATAKRWSREAGVPNVGEFGIVIDGAGSVITTGVKADLRVPYDCTITGWDLVADVSGSITIDIWKDTYANYPPTGSGATGAGGDETITGANEPALSSAIKNTDATLTGWTTSLTDGDYLRFNVDSATTVTRVTLTLTVDKT